jgi:hypothetical protein
MGTRHGNMETEKWRHGNMRKWRHGEMETWRNGDMEKWRHGNGDMETQTDSGPQAIFLIHLPFAHCANRSLPFVCLLTKKQMEIILLQTD